MAVCPLAAAQSRARTSASCCSRSRAYGGPSLKALGWSPGCCKLLAHSQKGPSACGHFLNPLKPETWAFLAAMQLFPPWGSLPLTIGSAHKKGPRPCEDVDTSTA